MSIHARKKAQGHEKKLRLIAIRMYADGLNFRQTVCHLGVSYASVINWVKAHVASLPEAPVSEEAYSVEMDELYTFIKDKKTGSTS